jgi:hypothetical protein
MKGEFNMSQVWSFNLNEVDENASEGFGLMPKGDYDMIVDNCEFQLSKASGAPMLKWTFKVINGEYENRLHWEYTVLNNSFGLRNLKKILIALNSSVDFSTFNPQTFAEEGIPVGENLTITMDIKKDKKTGEDRNVAKDFKVMTSGSFMGGFTPVDDEIPFL